MWILIVLCWVISFGIPYMELFMGSARFTVGGLPINLLDVLVPVALVCGIANTRVNRSYIQTARAHPLLLVILVAFAVEICVGVGVGMSSLNDRWNIIQQVRNVALVPMSTLAAYCLISNFQSANRLIYAMVLLGLYCSIMHLTHFASTAATTFTNDPNVLGTMEYGVIPMDMTTGILAFCFLVGAIRLLPTWLERAIVIATFMGSMSSMHRGTWLVTTGLILVTTLAVPARQRVRGAVRLGSITMALLGLAVVAFLVVNVFSERNLVDMIIDRLGSILPNYTAMNPAAAAKAWETRTPGLWTNLQIWSTSPLYGRGYGIGVTEVQRYGELGNHTPWMEIGSSTGFFGIFAYSVVVWGPLVIGRRMALAARDRTTMLIGILGLLAGVSNFFAGWMSLSINTPTGEAFLGVTAGMVLRCRAMQLEHQRQQEAAMAGAPAPMPWARPAPV